MTISSTTRKAGPFVGNGVQTAFPFAYRVFSAADVLVVLTNTASGVSETLSLGTDYQVTLNSSQNSNPGGSVSLSLPLDTGKTLLLGSNVQALQGSALTEGGGYYPAVIETALDRLVVLVQQLLEKLGRTLSLPFSVSGVSGELPAPVPGQLLGWNTEANALQNTDPASLAAGLSSVIAYGTTYAQQFSGNGTTSNFTLGSNAVTTNNVQVFVGGSRRSPLVDYALLPDGVTISFSTPPALGSNNILCVWQQALPTSSAVFKSETQTATAGQTVFTLSTLQYLAGAVGALSVYVNGLRVRKTADYLETSSTVVTFTAGLVVGDEVEFVIGSEVGTQGPVGPAGPQGVQGPAGPQGSQGIQGPSGANGLGTGTVTSVSVATANGFTATVATPNDTPAITIRTNVAGLLKGDGTGMSAAVAGTDYMAPGGALGTPSSGALTNCTADGTNPIGYRNVPQNSQSAAYTAVMADAGKHLLHPSADTTARTFTIPSNSSVAYTIGTALTFVNQAGAGVLTIGITTDTMRLAGVGTTGSRTLAANGVATALKITATEWIISGTGLA